ncbi:amino acid transporter [Alsobacter metallidurans]|uniref:Amino acid transporter n=2 Tax=Alsobacter metallidurans TaxID=340221 RepID=A0A917IBV1_9HYPH|nr:amino acid transporter [Alsobacter metallidurans]
MLGSGVYGLIGQAAGVVGNAVWLAFLVALVAALLTALSYASLGSRYPHAGGAAYVVQRAFRTPGLSFVVGLAVACASLLSVATQSRVFAANLGELVGAPSQASLIAFGFILALTGVVLRGIREAVWVNVLCTLIEAGGLLLVIGFGARYWGAVDYLEVPPAAAGDPSLAILAMQGAVLTFFAYIGFEDSINVAEECRDPQRTIPLGLIGAMLLSALLYVAVAVTAVSVVPWRDLAQAPGPLTAVMARAAPWLPTVIFTGITLFAVANTALVNYVTASRLLYGMARQGLVSERLGAVHDTRRTPHVAIWVILLVLTPLSLLGGVAQLAAATVLLLLAVFAVVNGALIVLKLRSSEQPGRFEVSLLVPVAGALACSGLVIIRSATGDWTALALAAAILAGIIAAFLVLRPKGGGETAP